MNVNKYLIDYYHINVDKYLTHYLLDPDFILYRLRFTNPYTRYPNSLGGLTFEYFLQTLKNE